MFLMILPLQLHLTSTNVWSKFHINSEFRIKNSFEIFDYVQITIFMVVATWTNINNKHLLFIWKTLGYLGFDASVNNLRIVLALHLIFSYSRYSCGVVEKVCTEMRPDVSLFFRWLDISWPCGTLSHFARSHMTMADAAKWWGIIVKNSAKQKKGKYWKLELATELSRILW